MGGHEMEPVPEWLKPVRPPCAPALGLHNFGCECGDRSINERLGDRLVLRGGAGWYRLQKRAEPVLAKESDEERLVTVLLPTERYYVRATAGVPEIHRVDISNTVILSGVTDTVEFGRIVADEFDAQAWATLKAGLDREMFERERNGEWSPELPPEAFCKPGEEPFNPFREVEDELGSWNPDAVDWLAPAIFRETARDALASGALRPPISEVEFIDAVMDRVLAPA